MLRSEGLMDQLQRQSDRDVIKAREGREGRAVGKGGRYSKNANRMESEPQLVSRNWRANQRAGGGGKGENERLTAISKKLSLVCRHSKEVNRQKGGFVSWREIMTFFNQKQNANLMMKEEDVDKIAM